MSHNRTVISTHTTTIIQMAVANYCCAYCNFSTSLGHIQSVFQPRNFRLQCLKVSLPASSLSHWFQLIHYSTTLTFQCLYLLQINKISGNKYQNPQWICIKSKAANNPNQSKHTFSSQRLALAFRSLAPPEITPDFWKRVPSRETTFLLSPPPKASLLASSMVWHNRALPHANCNAFWKEAHNVAMLQSCNFRMSLPYMYTCRWENDQVWQQTMLNSVSATFNYLPYSQKIWQFGGLSLQLPDQNLPKFPTCISIYGNPILNCQIKTYQY